MYKLNPWQYLKSNNNSDDRQEPTFTAPVCEDYFSKILSEPNANRAFFRPQWMCPNPPPTSPFPDTPPTYKDVIKIVGSMKASSSPCPLDAISIIIFKRCPILCTYLADLISACWVLKYFPRIWRRASVALIHKKGDTSDPQNFRPIALQPVLGKILNACIRNKIWRFLTSNKLLDTTMQKGFWPGINGVTEHVEQLSYLLNHQKKMKREIYVVLLDLKNAFGEVHHSLIRFSLAHHHVPSDVIGIIMSQYSDFFLTVTSSASGLYTGPIHVQRGVLQGDTLSPLLFNIVFDSLMASLSDVRIQSHGVLWGDGVTRSLWSQFADDAAVTCDNLRETQLLLTYFQRWTAWADLIIRPDKSFAYAAAQRGGHYRQIQPTLLINGVVIPSIEDGGFMTYLGRRFPFASDLDIAKKLLLDSTSKALTFVDALPISPSQKCHALNLQLRAHLSFTLSHYRVSQTWIQAHLDTLITNKVRRWLDLPPSATAHFLPLPAKWLGLDLVLPSMLAEVCQLNTALALRHSGDPKMAPLQELGGVRTPFKELLGLASKRKAMEAAKAAQITKHLGQLDGLQIQSVLLKALRVSLTATELTNWSTHVALISPTIANFARKALIRCLPTNSNLHRWGKTPSDSCPACAAPETENHVLSNCEAAAQQGRYTWRHNAVLKMLATHIQTHLSSTDGLYVDLPGFKNPSDIYTSILPDITVVRDGRASILELTCCYGKNVEASRQYKLNKYKNPSASSTLSVPFFVHTAEVTCLGFVPTTDLASFCREAGIPPIPPTMVRRMGEMSLRCSFYIFCSRHKKWPENLTEPYFH